MVEQNVERKDMLWAEPEGKVFLKTEGEITRALQFKLDWHRRDISKPGQAIAVRL